MDTNRDFMFLQQRIADQFNPFTEGEYLVIQTYPVTRRLRIEARDTDYPSIKSCCDLENLAHDYTNFAVRVFHAGKLWHTDTEGNPSTLSKQQAWRIHADFKDLPITCDTDDLDEEAVMIHPCSYPYVVTSQVYLNRFNEPVERLQPVTCLEDDHGRNLDRCPNCGNALMPVEYDALDEDDVPEPPTLCQECQHLHGTVYNGTLFVCGYYPSGYDDEVYCPCYSSLNMQKNAHMS